MLRLILVFLSPLFFMLAAHSQTCLAGGATLSTQQQIDDFPTLYPGCSTIGGNLTIQESTSGGITDLTPLIQITEITGRLLIFDLSSLSTLTGLGNLVTASSSVRISKCDGLTDLSGLGGLTNISSFLRIDNNDNLTSVDGLNVSLEIDGLLKIDNNDELLDLDGLTGVSQIGSATLEISGNSKLADISGIDNISAVTIINLIISGNTQLEVCSVPLICDYLEDPSTMATVSGNATGCASRTEVENSCSPLPVTFQSFDVVKQNKVTRLTWETALEAHNQGFQVQHSTDGRNFTTIGFVDGLNQEAEYEFLHLSPAGGINYYRLEQEGFDGTVSFSPVRFLRFDTTIEEVIVFPNPVSDVLTVRGLEVDERTILRLLDGIGRIVTESKGQRQLNVKDLATGEYFLEIVSGEFMSRKLIVVAQ